MEKKPLMSLVEVPGWDTTLKAYIRLTGKNNVIAACDYMAKAIDWNVYTTTATSELNDFVDALRRVIDELDGRGDKVDEEGVGDA